MSSRGIQTSARRVRSVSLGFDSAPIGLEREQPGVWSSSAPKRFTRRILFLLCVLEKLFVSPSSSLSSSSPSSSSSRRRKRGEVDSVVLLVLVSVRLFYPPPLKNCVIIIIIIISSSREQKCDDTRAEHRARDASLELPGKGWASRFCFRP